MARGVKFTEDGARRIVAATQAYERGNRDQSPVKFRQASGSDGDPIRIGKTSSAWEKGTLATITLYESGSPPYETADSPPETIANCVNKFADVPNDKWVALARAENGRWYLIAAEC